MKHIVDNIFHCPDCGVKVPTSELDYAFGDGRKYLKSDASLTCPVCNSKFSISALLTEPGGKAEEPGVAAPPTPEEEPVTPPEEGGETEVPPAPEAGAEEEGPGQITAKGESKKDDVRKRVTEALEAVKSGKPVKEAVMRLIKQDMKDLIEAGLDPNGNPVHITSYPDTDKLIIQFGHAYTWEGVNSDLAVSFLKNLNESIQSLPSYQARHSNMITDSARRIMLRESFRAGRKSRTDIKEARYIDLTPTPREYRHMLNIIIKHANDEATRDWAKEELAKVKDVDSWRTPKKVVDPGMPQDRVHVASKTPETEKPVVENDERIPQVGDMYSFYGMRVEVLEVGDVTKDPFAEISFKPVNPHDGTTVKTMTVYDFLSNPFKLVKAAGESKLQISKKLAEKKDDMPKEWEGEFDIFNAKLFRMSGQLDVNIEDVETIISALTDKDALTLSNDKVKIDLKKAEDVLVDFLKGKSPDEAGQPMGTPPTPMPQTDLGSEVPEEPMPEPAQATLGSESIKEEEEKDEVREKVKKALATYFA